MANKKISQLDAAATLDGTELVEIVQDGGSVRTTAQDIADLGGAGPTPLIVADFANEVYLLDGAASSLTGIFGEDTENWGTRNAGLLVPGVGIVAPGGGGEFEPVLSAAALAVVGFQFTCIAEMSFPDSADSPGSLTLVVVDFPDYARELDLSVSSQAGSVPILRDWAADTHVDAAGVAAGVTHKVGVTSATDRLSRCVDGSTVATLALGTPPDDANAVAFNFSGGTLKSLTFYPVQTDADLPGLLASGTAAYQDTGDFASTAADPDQGTPRRVFTQDFTATYGAITALTGSIVTTTIAGLLTTDQVQVECIESPPSGMIIANERVSAADTLELHIITAVALGITLGELDYRLTVIR